jgi:tetratricopeptide (TPR) repeat protein
MIRSIAAVLLGVLLLPAAALAGDREGPSAREVKQMIKFGISLGKEGLWKEALHRWQAALRYDPDNPQLHNNIAVALESQGDLEGARASYKRAEELDANARYVKRNIANFEELFTALEQYETEYREPPAGEAGDGDAAGGGDAAVEGDAVPDGDTAAAEDPETETDRPDGDQTAEEEE